MPWEHLDESAMPGSSSMSVPSFESDRETPASVLSELEPASTIENVPIAGGEPLVVDAPAQSAGTSLDFSLPSGDEAVAAEPPMALNQLPEVPPDSAVGSCDPPLYFTPPAPPMSESASELTEPVDAVDVPLAESGTLPSRMPWEHVADPSLQIEESEPPGVANPPTVGDDASVLQDAEPTLSPPLSLEPSSAPLSPASSSEHGDSDRQDLVESEPAVPPAESMIESSPTPPSPSSPLSFSWNAIFDSAWRIATGTTAPGTPDMAKEVESTATAEPSALPDPPDVPVESREQSSGLPPAGDGVGTSVPDSSVEFAIAPTPPSMGSSTDMPWQGSVPEPSVNLPTSLQSNSERQEFRAFEELRILEPANADSIDSAPPFGDSMEQTGTDPEAADAPLEVEAAHVAPAPKTDNPDFRLASDEKTTPVTAVPEPAPVMEPQPKDELPNVPVVDATRDTLEPAAPPSETDARWSTGEVAVQHHRPTVDKKKWDAQPADAGEPRLPSTSTEAPIESVSALSQGWESTGADEAVATVPSAPVREKPVPPPQDTRPEWAQASDAIVLDQPVAPTSAPLLQPEPSVSFEEPSRSPVAAAVDALFGGSGESQAAQPTVPAAPFAPRWSARWARLRFATISLIGSCFSTTRAFVLLCISLAILSIVVMAIGVGLLAVSWIAIEETPTTRYQALTSAPQRTITDPKNNGFLLLLGLDAPSGSDPLKAGYERKPGEQDLSESQACMSEHEVKAAASGSASTSGIVGGWFKSADPIAQMKTGLDPLRPLLAKERVALSRYQQFLGMPFDDWGFGQILSPNCEQILLTHRLYVIDGFNQDLGSGVARLEKDMESWRTVLGQSKTLMVKMLAVGAVQDDVKLASSALTRSDADAAVISRLSRLVRPLDQLELSIRWPMQSQFAWATQNVAADLKKYSREELPFYVSMAAAMPLPVQRRANAYAEYYEAANKAVAEGRYGNLPKRSQFVRTSAASVVDYLANPLEHIIGLDPLPSWDPYVGRMVETDAQLRLASLQAWVRRGPQEGDVLTRLAKAGQAYYDPFTGFPMLVNQEKRLLYSVGRDGKDQGGDPGQDVVVAIPSLQSGTAESKHVSK
jgi:hypothetical protein